MTDDGPVFKEHVSLKGFCTYGIGGPARHFLEIHTIEEMQAAIKHCHKNALTYFILGKGSNILFDDKGFSGVVLLNKIDFLEQPVPGTFHVGAGYNFSLLGVQTARQGWAGLEFASGIPGSVGGAVYMNAGANGAETCQYLQSVDFVDEYGSKKTIAAGALSFSYRLSSFQKKKGAIVGATFSLVPDSEARKKQIEIVNYRIKTQPYGAKSAGCVFVNPECSGAGALIDTCGLKGASIGGAAVSDKHANFLINTGNATSQEMMALIQHVQTTVKEKIGVHLASEVRFITYDKDSL